MKVCAGDFVWLCVSSFAGDWNGAAQKKWENSFEMRRKLI